MNPFDLINHVRAEFIAMLERKYSGYSLVQVMDLIDGELAFLERMFDYGVACIYDEYRCDCGATIYNCVCDDFYVKMYNKTYTPNELHKRHNF